MRLAVPIALLALFAALLVGCGGGSSSDSETSGGTTGGGETQGQAHGSSAPAGASAQTCETQAVDAQALRATAVSCGEARAVMFAWQRAGACAAAAGASHSACTVRSYRCIAAATDRGQSVSCAKPGRSLAFIAKR